MIFIAKKQKLAQQSAKTLIDFTNIMETDIGEMQSTRQHHGIASSSAPGQIVLTGGNGGDEVIVFDMK